MANFYIRNSLGNVSEDGSQLSPFKTFEALHTALGGVLTNNTIYVYSDDTFDERVNQTSLVFTGHDFTIQPYRSINSYSSRPVVTRAKRNLTWSLLSGGVYISNEALGYDAAESTYNGCITENGIPMTFVEAVTDRATTVALLSAGKFSYDPVTGHYLIYPTTGTPSDNVYVAVAGVYSIFRFSDSYNFTISEINQEYAGGTSLNSNGHPLLGGWAVQDCIARFMGGNKSTQSFSTGQYSGDGISLVGNTATHGDSFIRRCTITDIFDVASAPQTYSENTHIENIRLENNIVARCGMYGLMFANVGSSGSQTNGIVKNCIIQNNTISDIGYGWSGNRGGHGILISSVNPNAGTKVESTRVLNNAITNCIDTGIFLSNTNGNGVFADRNNITACDTGIVNTSITGRIATHNKQARYNYISNCTTGIVLGRANSGLAGSIQTVSNNTIVGCITGISDISKTGDTVVATNNLIIGATTGIRSDGVGTFTKQTNNLSNCTTNYSGTTQQTDTLTTVTLDADYVPSTLLTGTAQQPDVDYNGNYSNSIVGATNKANQHIVGYFI